MTWELEKVHGWLGSPCLIILCMNRMVRLSGDNIRNLWIRDEGVETCKVVCMWSAEAALSATRLPSIFAQKPRLPSGSSESFLRFFSENIWNVTAKVENPKLYFFWGYSMLWCSFFEGKDVEEIMFMGLSYREKLGYKKNKNSLRGFLTWSFPSRLICWVNSSVPLVCRCSVPLHRTGEIICLHSNSST